MDTLFNFHLTIPFPIHGWAEGSEYLVSLPRLGNQGKIQGYHCEPRMGVHDQQLITEGIDDQTLTAVNHVFAMITTINSYHE